MLGLNSPGRRWLGSGCPFRGYTWPLLPPFRPQSSACRRQDRRPSCHLRGEMVLCTHICAGREKMKEHSNGHLRHLRALAGNVLPTRAKAIPPYLVCTSSVSVLCPQHAELRHLPGPLGLPAQMPSSVIDLPRASNSQFCGPDT